MRRASRLHSLVIVFLSLLAIGTPGVSAGKRTLATITGSVSDTSGNPVAGAVVSLIKEGASEVIKQTRTTADGKFSARVSPGRYGIRAIAAGFQEVVFSNIEVRASQELIYRFNLEPVGSGKTLPERRKDRDDVRWTLRSAQTRRSIFQVQESEDSDIKAAVASDQTAEEQSIEAGNSLTANHGSGNRPQGALESYFATNSYGSSYTGLNFAVAIPANERVELIFAGQTGVGSGAPERFEAAGRIHAGQRHRVGLSAAGMRFTAPISTARDLESGDVLGQFSVRAVDEWIVRDGVVIVVGLDYSRFVGGGGAHAITPRLGLQFDANARTRVRAAFAPAGDEGSVQSVVGFEDSQVVFSDGSPRPVAFVDGRAVMERSHRLEFGVERVLDNNSNLEATAFFDTTTGRGVGVFSMPLSAFSGEPGEALVRVANQQGTSRGMRLVYTCRLSRVWTASAGYSFGRGQRLSSANFSNPAELFSGGFFQTAALQLGAGFSTGTHVRTILRFSPDATVFAIDPFAGRLGVYDPSLSIQVTQELPTFGLPLRAEAILDARNLLDAQASIENGEVLTQLSTGRRSVRGGILVRF
jgi:carboxypeptidase family protein